MIIDLRIISANVFLCLQESFGLYWNAGLSDTEYYS